MKKIIIVLSILFMFGCLSQDDKFVVPDDNTKKTEETKKNTDDTNEEENNTNNEEEKEQKYLFLLYMAADNNLDEYSKYDLNEIKSASINREKIEVIIFIDDETNDYTPGYYIKNGNKLELLKTISEPNTGNESTLRNFLNYSYDNYCEENMKVILDIWNHGDGWLDDNNSTRPNKAIANDDTNGGDNLNLWEFQYAIENSSFEKVDVIYFDACLMGTIEVGYQLRNSADYLAFSPDFIPGLGAEYTGILQEMTKWATSKEIAINMNRITFQSYNDGEIQDGFQDGRVEEAVYSVVDQSKVDELVNNLTIVMDKISLDSNLLNKIKYDVLFYNKGYGYNVTPRDIDIYTDLGSLFKEINGYFDNSSYEILNLLNSLDDYVVSLDYQNGNLYGEYSLDGTTGLSIYFNLNGNNKRSEYQNASSFAQDTGWYYFIRYIE